MYKKLLVLIICFTAPLTATSESASLPWIRNYSLPVAATALTAATAYTWQSYQQYRQALTWNWTDIENNAAYPARAQDFPKNFLWGIGTSSYQVEGNCTNSTYANWKDPHSNDFNHQAGAGIACDHWNRYKEDIHRMKHELGVNCYRFSIEWSKIETHEGVFDPHALMHYVDVCKELIKQNIKPVLGFHHYSDPQWFMDKGGFAKSENIQLFVRFCTTVFETLARECPEMFTEKTMPYFLTFNSPASYAANGYLTGTRPPGKKNMHIMAEVLKNMLEAHVQAYQEIKKSAHGNFCKVGITHNIYQLDPMNWCNPLHRIKCHVGNFLVHDSVYNFFRTGIFNVAIPTKASVHHENPQAPASLDFVGLNYYCHGYVGLTGGPQRDPQEIPTNSPLYTLYAEGAYRAIKELSDKLTKHLNIPIIMTENGISTNDDAQRDLFLKRYLYALARAHNDGYHITGYIHWSFMDNYEWGNYYSRYGLYHIDRTIDPETGQPKLTRTLTHGARYFVDLIKEHTLL